ncbi:MAG: ABC transporter substrate-binding protein [Deltaproteobacteria bacterium]|nr:ABC transporter substrate-binding protein [Deltaproteobacteria bacterium]
MKNRLKSLLCISALLLLTFAVPASALEGRVVISPSCWGSGVLDPHQITTGCEIQNHAWAMFNGLLQRNKKGDMSPSLATDWDVSDNGLTYTFYLRKGIKFQNGDPFTAKDVKFSFDRVLSDEVRSIRKPIIARFIDKVVIDNPYQVTVYLRAPYPALLERVGDYMLIMPKDYYQKVGKKGFEKAPIGTGPFQFVRREGNDALYFKANENYWGEGPFIKELVLRNIPELSTKWAALQTGEIDAACFIASPYLEQAKKSSRFKIITSRGAAMFTLWPRLDKPTEKLDAETRPLVDARVRRALTMALDRQALIDATLYGYGTVMKYNICPNERGYREQDKPIPYDPAGAKKLLAEAGYPNGFKTRINTGNDDISQLQAQLMQAQLAEVGIQVTIEVMDRGTAFKRGFALKDLSGMSVAGWYACTHFEPWGWKGLVSPFTNPVWAKLQALYSKAVTAYKVPDRQRIADEIRELLKKEVLVIPLVYVDWPWIVRSNVADWPVIPAHDLIASTNLIKLKK